MGKANSLMRGEGSIGDGMRGRYSTSIRIDPKLWKEAKKAAIDADITLSELVEEAIREWIRRRRDERGRSE